MTEQKDVIIVTTDYTVPGRNVQAALGVVWGTGVAVLPKPSRSKPQAEDQVKRADTARRQAYRVLTERAREMGANAVIGIGMDSLAMTETLDGDTLFFRREYTIYGTAVVIDPAGVANGG